MKQHPGVGGGGGGCKKMTQIFRSGQTTKQDVVGVEGTITLGLDFG